ncbi:MAG: hypothetical protein WAU01_08485, partial [Saprospiraceae bacterium]
MQLNEMGQIAEAEWLETFKIRLDMNLEMGEFVLMPNHFHAIIEIGENKYNAKRGSDVVWDDDVADCCRDAMHC